MIEAAEDQPETMMIHVLSQGEELNSSSRVRQRLNDVQDGDPLICVLRAHTRESRSWLLEWDRWLSVYFFSSPQGLSVYGLRNGRGRLYPQGTCDSNS